MKKINYLLILVISLGVLLSCREEAPSNAREEAVSRSAFIDSELKSYEGAIDVSSVRQALVSFDKTVETAYEEGITDESKLSEMFIATAHTRGMAINQITDEMIQTRAQLPTELLNVLSELVKTVEAKSIDEYISNLNAFERQVKNNSNLQKKEKRGVLASVAFLKVAAKLVKIFPPRWLNKISANEKWAKQLKCAFESITQGIVGAINGCNEGAAKLKEVGNAFGNSGIGSIVGCAIGATIKGIVTIADTAKECIAREGLDKDDDKKTK